jgi:hypothetical protein
VVADAESVLSTLDDDVQFSDGTSTSGSMARIALSRAAVDALRSELQEEMQKRVEAVRKCAFGLPNGHLDGTTSGIEDLARPESTPSQGGDQLLLTPNGNARPEQAPPVASPEPQDTDSPVSIVVTPEEIIDGPFIVPAPVALPVTEITEYAIVQEIPSPSIQDSASTSATLLVAEEPKTTQPHSPAVSILDLRDDIQPSCTDEPPTTDLPSNDPVSDAQVLAEQDTTIPPTSTSPMPAAFHVALDPPYPNIVPPTLFSELETTKHRYDALQRTFRDCSLALKELKRTLASASPSSHAQTRLRQHLETALARIDDYAEDARVELEIRVADEELTVRGFEMVLSVPGALVDADERTEVTASARAFVDGTDDGVAKALDKFGKKLEDVEHDVAVVKRAVHGLAMSEGESEEDEGRDESVDGSQGWTAWTAGLLGANTTPTRSPTPVQTFGAVMTSPRLRHAASLKQLRDEGAPERGPLAGLDLRIPMPSPLPAQAAWAHLGLGRAGEGETRPRTLSAMYAVGGLRSASSVGLGVGLGGSPSPARARGMSGLGMGGAASPLHARNFKDTNTREVHDLGGVE